MQSAFGSSAAMRQRFGGGLKGEPKIASFYLLAGGLQESKKMLQGSFELFKDWFQIFSFRFQLIPINVITSVCPENKKLQKT
jgi:hypothetical protein